MRSPRLLNVCVFIILILAGAQNIVAQEVVWKRLVAREIELNTKLIEKVRIKDSTLVDMLDKAIRRGEIGAYSGIDHTFSNRIGRDGLDNLYRSAHDTTMVVDPVTGVETIKIIKPDVDFKKYRILEEWAFDRSTGITTIQILGIAPLMQVYGTDFDAVKVLFWVKYAEAANIIARHDRLYPSKAVATILGKAYFGKTLDIKPLPFTNIWTQITRVLDLDPENNTNQVLKNVNSDSTLSDIISSKIVDGKINIYDSLGKVLPRSAIYPPSDTVVVTDPVTGYDCMRVIKYCLLFYRHDPKYRLIEECTFAPYSGIAQIKISYIVPFGKNGSDAHSRYPESPYWLKFDDISGILSRYEHSHYNNSLANLLWNDYFLTVVETKKK